MTWAVEPLAKHHDRQGFDCGQTDLNDFLRLYALQQQSRLQNKTYVACGDGGRIEGFYSLSIGSLGFAELPADMQKRLGRYPVPVILIGRFAVDVDSQGLGLGRYLLAHALHKVCSVAGIAGAVLAMVDAKDGKAEDFYRRMGFRTLPDSPLRMFIPVAELMKAKPA